MPFRNCPRMTVFLQCSLFSPYLRVGTGILSNIDFYLKRTRNIAFIQMWQSRAIKNGIVCYAKLCAVPPFLTKVEILFFWASTQTDISYNCALEPTKLQLCHSPRLLLWSPQSYNSATHHGSSVLNGFYLSKTSCLTISRVCGGESSSLLMIALEMSIVSAFEFE